MMFCCLWYLSILPNQSVHWSGSTFSMLHVVPCSETVDIVGQECTSSLECNTPQYYCSVYLCFVHLIKQKHKQVLLNSYQHFQMQSFETIWCKPYSLKFC